MMKLRVAIVVAALAAACGGNSPIEDESSSALGAGVQHARVCPASPDGARCHAWVRVDAKANPAATAGPTGLNPADLASAYKLNTAAGAGQTVAIVDAFDDPNAESDLATYRAQFGLPPCTTANGCFRKINQNGGTPPPAADSGWGAEIALDIDMVSAACPLCKILLVEASSPTIANLGTA